MTTIAIILFFLAVVAIFVIGNLYLEISDVKVDLENLDSSRKLTESTVGEHGWRVKSLEEEQEKTRRELDAAHEDIRLLRELVDGTICGEEGPGGGVCVRPYGHPGTLHRRINKSPA